MKKKLKRWITKLPGVRGVLKKWRTVLADIGSLKRQVAEANTSKKEINASKKEIVGAKKEIDASKKQINAGKKRITALEMQMEALEGELRKNCLAADLERLRNRYNEIKWEKMFLPLAAGNAGEQAQTFRYAEKIEFLEKEHPFVSVIMLNRNGRSHLEILMKSLHEREYYRNFEIICVDNASGDGSVEYLESWKDEFDITIIRNNENMSFSVANNLGVKSAKGEYLLFLNNDTEVTDGWLDELLFSIKDASNAGAIGAKLVYPMIPSGTVNKGKFYSIQHAGIAFRDTKRENAYFIMPYNMDNGKPDADISCELRERIGVTAAVMLMSRTAFDVVGGFDERYIYGYEDVDICLKLYKAGYRNYYCPTCLVYHYEFGTQNDDAPSEVRERRLNNMHVFKGKWQRYLEEKLYNEKLYDKRMQGNRLFTEDSLTVAFAVTEATEDTTAGDYFTALELSCALEKLGYNVKFLSRRGKTDWYNVGMKVDVLISMLDAYDITKVCNCKNDLITIAWARNWFDRWCEQEYFGQYDMVFASSETACRYIEERSGRKAILFPIATNADRFAAEVKITAKEKERFKSDYAFTGSYWNVKREIMDDLTPSDISYTGKIFGANWEQVEKYRDCTQGFVKYKDMPKIYRNTKIVIDDANHVTRAFGAVNSRVFDALAAGALVLTNGTIGAEETFHGMLPSFTGKAELEAKLTYYLEHEEDRLELVTQLKNFVLENHTYDVRAQKLREILTGRLDCEINPKEIDICGAMPDDETKKFWGDQHFAVGMKKEFEKRGYKANILPRDRWFDQSSAKYVIVLRGKKPYYQPILDGRKYIMWNISHPSAVTVDELNSYAYVFFASEQMYREINPKLSIPSGLLLQCTDSDAMVYQEEPQEEYDLLFIGNSRHQFRPVLKDLLPTKHKLAVYGRHWNKFPVFDYVVKEYMDNAKIGQAYHDARIVLNDHYDDMREYDLISNRIFDVLAAGGFVISDYLPGIETVFENNVVTYQGREDLKEKIDYYLEHEEERKKKAKAGQKIVLERHTFQERVKAIIEVLETI
ncbi:MAG: glycosyltransferase [Clostridiales bacterium]|nr:glycosyltransferase [Clostridiales bacterium]